MAWAQAWHETPYGRAAVRWDLTGDDLLLRVTVPPSTTADVVLPDGSAPLAVGPGQHEFSCTLPPEHVAGPAAEFAAAG